MEPGYIVSFAIFMLLVGFLGGVLVGIRSKKACGVIHVDYSDPNDGPYLFLELSVPVKSIVDTKRVVLDVDTTKYYSHE